MKRLWLLFFILLCPFSAAWAGEIFKEFPSSIDQKAKYLFFFPGLAVEMQGPDAFNPSFRKVYQWTALTKAFADNGYNVIAELRPKGTQTSTYAKRVSDQVRQLVSAGVSPKNIVLVGHSKGGEIVIGAIGANSSADISYVVLAGCAMPHTQRLANETPRANYEGFLEEYRGRFKGRVLSMYDEADDDFQTCKEISKDNPEVRLEELVLRSDSPPKMGHALFFAPEPIWMTPLLQWLAK